MNALTLARRLAGNDVRLILRDPLLAMLCGLALAIAVGARFALPAIDAGLAEAGLVPAEPGDPPFSATFPLWVTFIGLWQAAVMPGTIFGFLLLDEKEDRTLLAMRVTPVPFEGYLAYRVALPTMVAFALALAILPLMGHAPVPLGPRIFLAACAALAAPIITLVLAAAAHDKVQGFAYTKFVGVAGLAILGGWFVQGSAQWALGLFPPFLVHKGYWMYLEGTPGWWASALVGAALQAGLLAMILRAFRARMPTD